MRYNYARSPKGQAAYSSESYRPTGKVNLLACMSLEGVVAPWLVENGTVNTQVFTYYLEHILIPELKQGQILILDNYPIHKALKVRELIEQKDCKLMFLPTYSPDFNPIELLFSKLKAKLREISASTMPQLSLSIQKILKAIPLDNCINWFKHAGYIVF